MISSSRLRRAFSVSFYKELKYPMGGMSFCKDWVNDKKGDPYPLISRTDGVCENICGGKYSVKSETAGHVKRYVGAFFPYATYQANICALDGAVGFEFACRGGEGSDYTSKNAPKLAVFFEKHGQNGRVSFVKREGVNETERGGFDIPSYVDAEGVRALTVTARATAFDVYVNNGLKECFVGTVDTPELISMRRERNFSVTDALLCVSFENAGLFETDGVSFYLDCGVSQADIRPIKYEDGSPAIENGRVFLTASARAEAGGYQAVLSWDPTSADFKLEGAIFYDCGDGEWCSDVAASVIYDRASKKWLVWYCSFSHGHILAHGVCYSDIRHGITVIDSTLMQSESVVYGQAIGGDTVLGAGRDKLGTSVLSDDRLFFAKSRDEDPDMIYDSESGKWLLAVCRHSEEHNAYRYFIFESDDPFTGYKFKTISPIGVNTGGSLVKIDGRIELVFGSDFNVRACYYRFPIDDPSDFQRLTFDHDDGGFRGWGSIIPLTVGTRTLYAMITFDRHCGSSYNWSYGNIYVFFSYLAKKES